MARDDPKPALRERARSLRRKAMQDAGPDGGRRMAEHGMGVITKLSLPARPVVAGYWPVGAEADVRPLLEQAATTGMHCALPVVQSRSTPLLFRLWDRKTELVSGAHGTLQPDSTNETVTPDVVLTPLLAFDRVGFRLGQGGGYYDRTLADLRTQGRVVVIGIAFKAQEVDVVPRAPHDQPLDWIVTEVGARRFGER